ncbi:MAG: response regulator transcription factor [Bacteroidetes bacterium]|nr:response regulator transcription factor [Bacteroidota bacterium]
MKKFTVVIADDEPLARKAIAKYLSAFSEFEVVAQCGQSQDILRAIRQFKPDLLLLDIEMPEMNGFQLLAELDPATIPLTIFITAHDNFALQAFEANAVDYILKPIDQSRFNNSIAKAMRYLGSTSSQSEGINLMKLIESYDQLRNNSTKRYLSRILIKENKKYFFIKPSDVVWFEASGDHVIAHMEKGKHYINENLGTLEPKLDPEHFVRIHRSTIIHLDSIRNLQPYFNGEYHITLKNGDAVKLSRNYKEKLKIIIAAPDI